MPERNPVPGAPRPHPGTTIQPCAPCAGGDHDRCTDRDERSQGVPADVLDLRVAWKCKCRKRRHQGV